MSVASSACPSLLIYPKNRTLSAPVRMSQTCQEETHAPQQKTSLFDHFVGAALVWRAIEIRCARKLLRGPLFGRHRLADDDAQGRLGWDNLSHDKSGAFKEIMELLTCPLQGPVLYHHVQIRELAFRYLIWRTDDPLDYDKSRLRRHGSTAGSQNVNRCAVVPIVQYGLHDIDIAILRDGL